MFSINENNIVLPKELVHHHQGIIIHFRIVRNGQQKNTGFGVVFFPAIQIIRGWVFSGAPCITFFCTREQKS